MHSNVDLLTHAHAVLKAKARAKKNQIEHIPFDEQARHEYLTGFHKRNLLKKEAAKNKAKERERQDRLQARREQRLARQEQAKRNADLAERAYRKDGDSNSGQDDDDDGDGSEDEFTGFSAADKGKGKGKQMQDAFEDDEQLATVTIVEEFDPHALLHGPSTPQDSPSDACVGGSPSRLQQATSQHSKRRSSLTRRPKPDQDEGGHPERASQKRATGTLKKKVAYETKAARKAQRQKQRGRNLEKAARAGGKASRRDGRKGKR